MVEAIRIAEPNDEGRPNEMGGLHPYLAVSLARHPRNKATDDATALLVDFTQEPPPAATSDGESRTTLAAMMNRPVLGASPT